MKGIWHKYDIEILYYTENITEIAQYLIQTLYMQNYFTNGISSKCDKYMISLQQW